MTKNLHHEPGDHSFALTELVTVIVVPRERFSFAAQSLQSIVGNTPKGVPIIFVDGGSPDYLKKALGEEPANARVSFISVDRYLCPNEARNIGARAAGTKYLAFIDNDVLASPGWLDHLVDCAEATDADAVGPLCLIDTPQGEFVHFVGGRIEVTDDGNGRQFQALLAAPGNEPFSETVHRNLERSITNIIEFHCVLIKADTLKKLGMLDEELKSHHEHYDFSLAVLENGGEIYFEPASIIRYNVAGEWLVSDLPYFSLRWCDEWNLSSLDHFYRKRSYAKGAEYSISLDWVALHQRIPGIKRFGGQPHTEATDTSGEAAQTNLQLYRQLAALGLKNSEIKAVQDAYEFVLPLFGGLCRASGRPFLCHVVATASILAAHGAPVTMISAGLMHALYEQGALGRIPRAFDQTLRADVKARFAAEVDNILFQYYCLEAGRAQWRNADPSRCELTVGKAILLRAANDLDEYLSGEYAFSKKTPDRSIERSGNYAVSVLELLGYGRLASELTTASLDGAVATAPDLMMEREGSFAIAGHGQPKSSGRMEMLCEASRRLSRYTNQRLLRYKAWAIPRLIIGKLFSDPRWVIERVQRRTHIAWPRGKPPQT